MKKINKFSIFFIVIIFTFSFLPTNAFADTISNNKKNYKVVEIKKKIVNESSTLRSCDCNSSKYLSANNTNESDVVTAIADAYRNSDTSIDISKYKISASDIEDIIHKVYNQDLIAYNCHSTNNCGYSYGSDNLVTEIDFYYSESKTEFNEKYNKLSKEVTKITNSISSSMNDLEKALYVHDYIVKNTSYDYDNYLKNTIPDDDYTAYGALVYHTGVCSGYANAYKLLMDMLGIKCIVVTSDSMNHAWNMLQINNKWYHVDTTFDDPVPDEKGRVYHNNFIVNDSEISSTHSGWKKSDTPTSDSTDFSSWQFHNSISEISYVNNSWYYVTDENIYKSDVYGTNPISIKNISTSYYSYYNNRFYYPCETWYFDDDNNNQGTCSIKSCDLSGNDETTFYSLSDDSAYSNINYLSNTFISDDGLLTATIHNSDSSISEFTKSITSSKDNTKIKYSSKLKNEEWQDWHYGGDTSGTTIEDTSIQGIKIAIEGNSNLGVSYSCLDENNGWQAAVSNGATCGSTDNSSKMEALKISLTGSDASKYDIYYRVNTDKYGWLGYAKNGDMSGTSGYGYYIKAIQVILVSKGSVAPGSTTNSYYVNEVPKVPNVLYKTHVQNIGWQDYVKNGTSSGTTGKSLRLEAIQIQLNNTSETGGIKYRTHVQNIGWQNYVSNNALSGTSGKSLRLEAIEIELTDKLANDFDIYYRVHAEHFGWLGWAKNGTSSGTSEYGYRLEAIQIKIVPKGSAAPGSTSNSYYKK